MPNPLNSTTPPSLARAKRICKDLKAIFPSNDLAACQAATAQLFFFADWTQLENAIKANISNGPFDEDLSPDALQDRRAAQARIVASQLGEVDPDNPYPAPERQPFGMNQDQHLRMASGRFKQRLAVDAIAELAPTSRSQPNRSLPFDTLNLCKTEEFASLPHRLGLWWKTNIPYQPEVAAAITDFEFDPISSVAILKFASYWGNLCVCYAETIDWTMAMGVAQILAEGYSAVKLTQVDSFRAAEKKPPSEREIHDLAQKLIKEKTVIQSEFYRCFPRDDFFEVWLAQPSAFQRNAETVKKILKNPNSRRGVWPSK